MNFGLSQQNTDLSGSTSELYGGMPENKNAAGYYNERSPFYPRSPYGAAKIYAFWITKNYREAYGMYTCNGILFNHESPRRGETFVTRKITLAVAAIALGKQTYLYLGNLDAQRDRGHAKDYVRAMWLMLQQDQPEDYVIATGKSTKVRDFVQMAFACIGFTIRWEGTGVEEVGILDAIDMQKYFEATGKKLALKDEEGAIIVKVDTRYFRPTEVDLLIGDPTKANKQLGWTPDYALEGLVEDMMRGDINNK